MTDTEPTHAAVPEPTQAADMPPATPPAPVTSPVIEIPADAVAEPVLAADAASAEPRPAAPPAAEIPAGATAPARLRGLGRRATAIAETGVAGLTRHRWPAAAAVALILSSALGYGAAQLRADANPVLAEQRWAETDAELRQTHGDVARLVGEMKSLRASVDTLRRDPARNDIGAKQAAQYERLEKSTGDGAAKVAKLAEQIDRMEKTQRDPARIAALVERLDRIEKQTQTVAEKVTTPTPPPKPPVVSQAAPADPVNQTGSLAEAKPTVKAPEFDPRKTALDGFTLRDYDDGTALVEARNGRMIEVRPGQTVAGMGRIETIERRGRQWVVVTAKGFIGQRWP